MAAQSQQFFPLSALFEILNIDGKDRLLPIIRANEQHQQQMQQMQQQVEEMTGQLQQLEQENRSLKATTSQVTSALAKMGASGAIGRNQPAAQQLVQQARMQNIPPQLLEQNYEE
jgi:cell division septum initiation protein DivIVA